MSQQEEKSFKVIGAGWGRTGTMSFKKAMDILGQGPCYHMTEVFSNNHGQFWVRAANKETVDFDEIFKGKYYSSCDLPSCIYWKEMLLKYPDAKVVLTYRDPEAWYKSCIDTIYQCQPGSPFIRYGIHFAITYLGLPTKGFAYFMRKSINEDCYHDDFSKENVINHYKTRCQSIIDECPKDKLLVFKATDGWEPLCKFLNVPVPDVPYPRVNDSANFQKILFVLNALGYIVLSLPFIGVAAALMYFRRNSTIGEL